MIEVTFNTMLNGVPTQLQVSGICQRDFTRHITCEIIDAKQGDHDVSQSLSDRDRDAIKVRLVSQYLSNRHPLGDSVEL